MLLTITKPNMNSYKNNKNHNNNINNNYNNKWTSKKLGCDLIVISLVKYEYLFRPWPKQKKVPHPKIEEEEKSLS